MKSKAKDVKMMSPCRQSAAKPANMRYALGDMSYGKHVAKMSPCRQISPPCRQEGRGGPRSGEKPPLGGVSCIGWSKGVTA